jgi:lipopolysaccharide biosynthesis regulator YciM
MQELLILLLPVAAASGWWAARRSMLREKERLAASEMDSDYYRGLNYLINEQPDKAIDVFVRMLEVNSETVEMHLALGGLFRRRGEVDRAIRIHQNLIARQTLSAEQRAQALLALASDYMSAGLLDRAEGLYEELVENRKQLKPALTNLKLIYQHEKDWSKSLDVSRRLEKLGDREQGRDQAHFLCELAEAALAEGHIDKAGELLEQALKANPQSFRPLLIQARIAAEQGRHDDAIVLYKKIADEHPAFIGEVLEPMHAIFIRSDRQEDWFDWLRETYARKKNLSVLLQMTSEIAEREGFATATDYLTSELSDAPRLAGVHRLIRMRMAQKGDQRSEFLELIEQLLQRLLKEQSAYQCHRCGFTTRTLHWQCPGCRSWGSMLPRESSNRTS